MPEPSIVTTFLFTDIEGSSRLWEQEPERMRPALVRHDAILRGAVQRNHGVVVKTTGDGLYAAFRDPRDAVTATLEFQLVLADPGSTDGLPLKVRCGLHAGVMERRDGDFFGTAVNRAARIMSAAHGGQILASQAVADLLRDRLPDGVGLRDLGSVRLRDLSSPERLYQVEHAKLRGEFPALCSLEATPNNLPQQLTTFVGRERELQEIKATLVKARLVTLSGIGGIGKTRLSLQIAADVVGEYPDGVWFVEFAPITDERLVPQAVASVLGVKEEAGRPVMEALVKHVHDRHLLLVLDNCEHLVQACAELAMQLLQAGARVKILASSREHLNIAGEAIYTVSPLSVPSPERGIAMEFLQSCEAVHLFVERATAVQPAFALTEHNAPAVAEICRRLDGIPLALELAAARVRALSVEQIASRVNDRFRLLTTGDRTALPRQQTLRALIDWSYDLLSEAERVLFRRLAVFAGGWTLEAAEAVGMGGEIAPDAVLDLLAELVVKSLVVVDGETGRYRLLETVRQYAQERLEASDDQDATRSRHLAFYVELAEAARPALLGPQQAAWLARLDVERENLLSAHLECEHAERGGELGLRLVSAMKQYFFKRGLLGLGHRVMAETLAHPGAQIRNVERSRALFGVGQVCNALGRYAEALTYLEESLAIAREIGDRTREAAVFQPLGLALEGLGDVAGAKTYLDEAIVLARQIGNKREIAAALNNRAQLHRVQGELDAAQLLYEQVLALVREVGDHEYEALAQLNLAMVDIGREAWDRACARLLDVIAIAEALGSKPAIRSAVEVSAGLASVRGEWERAGRLFGAAEAHAAYTGLKRDPADDAFLAPLMANARAISAARRFDVAVDAGGALSLEEALGEAAIWLAECARKPRAGRAS